MNPFDQGTARNQSSGNPTPEPPFINLVNEFPDILGEPQPSKAEQFLRKVVDVFKKTYAFIIFAIGIGSLLLVSIPFMRLVWEFSIWAFKKAGKVF